MILFFTLAAWGNLIKNAESAVRRIKRTHPERSIRLVLVLPYLTHEINRDKEYFEAYYDDIVVPTELMGVHYKAASRSGTAGWLTGQIKYWPIFTAILEVPLTP